MQIVLLHEKYNWDSYSLVRSMYDILNEREDVELIPNKDIETMKPGGHIWCYSSQIGLTVENYHEMKRRGWRVINFGLSDPNMFNEGRLGVCDLYCTNDLNTYESLRLKEGVGFKKGATTVIHFPIGVDLNRFVKTDHPKTTDVLFVGTLSHGYIPRRKQYIMKLREDIDNFNGYGPGFDLSLSGQDLVTAYNQAHLNLDICTKTSSLASRIFQAAACGVPTLTLKRDDILECFEDGFEIMTYEGDYNDMKFAVIEALRDKEKLARMGENALIRCIADHGMRKRVDDLIKYLNA